LRTGAFDVMSDKEWVRLCERAHDENRLAKKPASLPIRL
jgi:hypothetical protein